MANQSNLFMSNITLKFSDSKIEQNYNKSNNRFLRRNNIIYNVIFLVISLIADILLTEFDYLYFNFYMNMISYCTTAIVGICLIPTLFIKSKCFQYSVCYIIYIISCNKFIQLRYFFNTVLKVDPILFALILGLETLVRITWFQCGSLDFIDGFICTLGIMVFNYVIFFPALPLFLQYKVSIYNLALLVMITIAYFYIKEKRKSFYLNVVLQNKNEWYNSILENINSGFIQIEDSEVTYMNKTIKGFFKTINGHINRNEINENNLLRSDELISNQAVKTILLNVFNEIVTNNNEKMDYASALKLLQEYYSGGNNNFYFLGRASYLINSEDNASPLHLEVYGRCSRQQNNKYAYEFLFNDISRVKVIEESNAEVKYKSLFLSKVAHEFKNPILCIVELIDQILDKIHCSSCTNSYINPIKEQLFQIKSMSDYMIILIKDLDFFSQKQTAAFDSNLVESGNVNLTDLITFCKNITVALIKKMQKLASVNFIVVEGDNLPISIQIDEIKLKQILINLLSNSVKYTNYGSIIFNISKSDGEITFSVKDTGKGISDSQKEKLFKPFSKDFHNRSTISTGLGLFIVKELAELIGGKLSYASKVNEGSEFCFSIDIPDYQAHSNYTESEDKIRQSSSEDSLYSRSTIVKEFNLNIDENIISNIRPVENTLRPNCSLCSIDWHSLKAQGQINIILVDDEILPRQSSLRLVKKFFAEKKICANVLEGDDGIDCLALFFNAFKNNVKIDFILSDQTMNLLNGTDCAALLNKIFKEKVIEPIPFFILTAYESLSAYDGVELVYSKPLSENKLRLIFDRISNTLL
jgi:signal transduction histidine kinase